LIIPAKELHPVLHVFLARLYLIEYMIAHLNLYIKVNRQYFEQRENLSLAFLFASFEQIKQHAQVVMVVANDVAWEFFFHFLWIDSLNMYFLDLVLAKLLIINLIAQWALLGLNIEFTEFHLENIGHFAFELPHFLETVHSHYNVGFIRTQCNLDGFYFIRWVLRHIFFQYVITIKTGDV
jgi:hypothetical protein